MLKPMKVMMNKRNAKEVTMIMKISYVALYVINRTMKTVSNQHLPAQSEQ